MNQFLDSQLISLIACPDCRGDLDITADRLQCTDCLKTYEIWNKIPCLYSSSTDVEHLNEEEALADMMKRTPVGRKDQFNSVQWTKSKKEFWGIVKNNTQGKHKTFINIGCGYDSNFVDFQKEGHIFINFDIVRKMLYSLQEDHGAQFCIAGDITKLPFRKASFDYVVSIDVIHHESENLKSVLTSISDLLKPGGTLFLEDPNAWGMFQAPKSILLPKPLYRLLRNTFHKIKKSTHRPADYEFPTNVWHIKKLLKSLNYTNITVYPNTAYPCIGPGAYKIFNLFSGISHISKYHNYHYMISAIKP